MVIVTSILDFVRRERNYRKTRSILHSMDDHRLRDIGIRRDQIDRLSYELRTEHRFDGTDKAHRTRGKRPNIRKFGGQGLAPQH